MFDSGRGRNKQKEESYKVYPLACLSLHERSYVELFGFGGKASYANKWLQALDWNKVWARTSRRDMVDLSGFENELKRSPYEKERKTERLGGKDGEKMPMKA